MKSIPNKRKPFTPEEDDFIRENYGTLTAMQIATAIGRSHGVVYQRIATLRKNGGTIIHRKRGTFVRNLKQQIHTLTQERDEMKAQMLEWRAQSEEWANKYELVKADLDTLTQERDNAIRESKGWQCSWNTFKGDVEFWKDQHHTLSTEINKLRGQLTEANEKLESVENDRDKAWGVARENADQLHHVKEESENLLKDAEEVNAKLRKELELARKMHDSIHQQYINAEREIDDLTLDRNREKKAVKQLVVVAVLTATALGAALHYMFSVL